MGKIYRHIFVLIILFTLIPDISLKINAAEVKNDDKFYSRVRSESKCSNRTGMDKVRGILNIKHGMTVLDIGTGTGQGAYKLAEMVGKTGKVFATDIDVKCINYVRQQVRKRRIKNLYPVLVKKEGLDEFYGKHRYDLILIFHSSVVVFGSKSEYFKNLSKFLKEEGHLAIMMTKRSCIFSFRGFTDFEGFIKEISKEPENSLFYNILTSSTWKLIKQHSPKEKEILKNAVIKDLNSALKNIYFSKDFNFQENVSFTPNEIGFVNELLLYLNRKNFFNRPEETFKEKQKMRAMQLNYLLIFQRFRQYLKEDSVARHIINDEYEVEDKLKESGFKLENKTHDIFPFEVIFVFSGEKNN